MAKYVSYFFLVDFAREFCIKSDACFWRASMDGVLRMKVWCLGCWWAVNPLPAGHFGICASESEKGHLQLYYIFRIYV